MASTASSVRRNNRTLLLSAVAVAVVLFIVSDKNHLLGTRFRHLRPTRTANQFRTQWRFVSFCSANSYRRRLGNQLFNWAAVMYLVQLTGARPAMLRRHRYGWIDHWFDVGDVHRVDSLSELCPCSTLSEGRALTFDPSIEHRLQGSSIINASTLLICGLFQSWKYAEAAGDELRRRLRWKPKIISAVRSFLEEVKPTRWNGSFLRVGIHVRAGDVLAPFNLVYGFTVPGSSYFIRALDYLTVNWTSPVQFIVSTDNPSWTRKYVALKEAFRNRSNVDVVYSESHNAGFDMALLASCDALVLSTGSYGWWAAWLANKTTIYYRSWPRAGSPIEAMFSREDYFPPNWIGLGNESDHTTHIEYNRQRSRS